MLIDTHRHLGGSISAKCIWNILQENNSKHSASSYDEVLQEMTFTDDKYNFNNFLNKFRILDEIEWTEKLIDISIADISKQIEEERINYCWLDFSINKYMNIGWHKWQAVQFIYERFQHYIPSKIGLILSLKYESAKQNQRQYSQLIDIISDYVIGVDLVGDETFYDSTFYREILSPWKKSGKIIRAHVGESKTKDNITTAILDIGVTNIAHGINGHDDDYIIQTSIDNNITYDMAITSNYLTGVWKDKNYHPFISMLKKGIKVTIGSDDPTQCDTNLQKEYKIAERLLLHNELPESYISKIQSTAIDNTRLFFKNI